MVKTVCAYCKVLIKDGELSPEGLVSHGICKQCKWKMLSPVKTASKAVKMLKSVEFFDDVLNDSYQREAIRDAYKRVQSGSEPEGDLECYIALFAAKS